MNCLSELLPEFERFSLFISEKKKKFIGIGELLYEERDSLIDC